MKAGYFLLLLIGAVTVYETIVHFSRYRRTHDDARLNRIRVLNQRGQPPNEIE